MEITKEISFTGTRFVVAHRLAALAGNLDRDIVVIRQRLKRLRLPHLHGLRIKMSPLGVLAIRLYSHAHTIRKALDVSLRGEILELVPVRDNLLHLRRGWGVLRPLRRRPVHP